uniref:Uncharacterized protein n=1 Tax=Anguilla anguilla TaxID=7936 RepID=A0A0E9T5J1_ANGAN
MQSGKSKTKRNSHFGHTVHF